MRFIDAPKKMTFKGASYYLNAVPKEKAFDIVLKKFPVKRAFLIYEDKTFYKTQTYHKKVYFEKVNRHENNHYTVKFKPFIKKIGKSKSALISRSKGVNFLFILKYELKKFYMAFLYLLFIFFAAFHAFNGIWSFLIRWGITLSLFAQKLSLIICYFLMAITFSIGAFCVWSNYFY